MKNLKNVMSIITLALVLMVSINVNAQNKTTDPIKTGPIVIDPTDPGNSTYPEERTNAKSDPGFWDTLLVDAGGALGGAGSVASILGGATAGTAAFTPVGWGAVALGGLVGGAASSVAYSKTAPKTGTKNDDTKLKIARDNDEVGLGHNQIIIDFHQTNSTYKNNYIFDKDAFYEFATVNMRHTKESPILSKKDYDVIVSKSLVLRNKDINEVLNYIDDYLPKSIDKVNFRKSLLSITSSKDFNELILKIKALEDSVKLNKLSEIDTFLMNTFFSTMRHSAILW